MASRGSSGIESTLNVTFCMMLFILYSSGDFKSGSEMS